MERLLQAAYYNENEIIKVLSDIDKHTAFKVINKVYYPYYHVEYQIISKGLLKINSTSGCVIDGVNGKGAIIDTAPEYEKGKVTENRVIKETLSIEAANEKAKSFLFHTASLKLKSLTTPQFFCKNTDCFYRPYWILEGNVKEVQHYLAVDAVTAEYHPI